MKAFLDTSVLVATFLADHVHHEASLDLYLRYSQKQAGCAVHSLIETYSVLTRLPGRHRVSGGEAMLFLDQTAERISIVSLSATEHRRMLRKCSELGVTGGAVHDGLIAHAALKARSESLYTWNAAHFRRLGPEVAHLVRLP